MNTEIDANDKCGIDISCPYGHKCLRFAYTKYLKTHKIYPLGTPPERKTLFLLGFATPEMAQVWKDNNGKTRYGGIFCENMPLPNGENHCPETVLQNYTDCHEYNRQKQRDEKLEKARKARRDKYPNARRRSSLSTFAKKEIAKRDKYTCIYCNRHNSLLNRFNVKAHIDHIIPLAVGGEDIESNLAFTCEPCNHDKGAEIWQRGCRIGYYDEE